MNKLENIRRIGYVLVQESQKSFYKMPDCFEKPHRIWGAIFFFFGAAFFLLAGGCFAKSADAMTDSVGFWFFTLGLTAGAICFWLICHAFGLLEFMVYPCPWNL